MQVLLLLRIKPVGQLQENEPTVFVQLATGSQ